MEEKDFVFDFEVVEVFDDMINRSIPFYEEIQNLIISFCSKLSEEGDRIVDLGCSNGNTLLNLSSKVNRELIGIDNSQAMISKANANKNGHKTKTLLSTLEFQCLDINPMSISLFPNTSIFILSLTLQFIRPIDRLNILKSIFKNLKTNGVIILIEKTTLPYHKLNRVFIDCYHRFKEEKGYSSKEIEKKRKEIENILIPFSLKENKRILMESGFSDIEPFFQWLNFSGLIGFKHS